jgi:hypothetical protein
MKTYLKNGDVWGTRGLNDVAEPGSTDIEIALLKEVAMN